MDNIVPVDSIPTKAKNDGKIGRIFGRAILYLILIIGAIIFIFPFFWMISNSLMTLGETITRRLLPQVPQWDNYRQAWQQAKFSK